MNRKTSEIEKLAAAFLAGSEGKTQAEIGRILGISQTVVSRLLTETKERYWRERVEFLGDGIDEATLQTVLQRVGKNKLAEALSSLARQGSGPVSRGPILRVFSGGGKNASDRERMAEFGRRSAPYIRELLIRCRTCGLTWGSMLWQVVNAVRSLRIEPPWAAEPIHFIPLSGEPLGNNLTGFSSSSLVSDLGRAVNGAEYHARSLAMVPAFIPEGFTEAELRGVWKLIGLVPSYNDVFGSRRSRGRNKEKPLAEKLDMILTSVGPADKVLGFGAGRLFETGSVTIEHLQQLVLGDMGGVCFERPDLNVEQRRVVRSVGVRWTGLRRGQLEACAAAAAADSSKPGVVVVSGGAARARFICDAVRLGVINHLIVDEILASELERVLGVWGRGAPSEFRGPGPGRHSFASKPRPVID